MTDSNLFDIMRATNDDYLLSYLLTGIPEIRRTPKDGALRCPAPRFQAYPYLLTYLYKFHVVEYAMNVIK